MRRRSLLVAVWIAGTLAATALASAAVRQVTAEVGPEPPLPVPSEVALGDVDARHSEFSGRRARGAATEQPGRDRPRRQAGDGAQPEDVNPPVAADDDGAGAAPPTPDETAEDEPAEQEAAPTTKSYSVQGGVVTVRYADSAARLVGASPASGFTVEVNDAGPPRVDVRFRSDEHESRLRAEWRNGRPDVQRDENDG